MVEARSSDTILPAILRKPRSGSNSVKTGAGAWWLAFRRGFSARVGGFRRMGSDDTFTMKMVSLRKSTKRVEFGRTDGLRKVGCEALSLRPETYGLTATTLLDAG